jgi:tetratricopeptide (TPR) repeat protein
MEARRLIAVALLSCISLTAQDAAALNAAGARALTSGDLKIALSQFEKAAKLDPKNPELQFNLGLTLLRLGRPEQAAAPLERASSDPDLSAEARHLLGTCYFQLLNHAKVVSVLKGLTDGPRAEHVLYMLEESNRMLGHVAEARDAFRELNRRFPDSAWTHYLMAIAYENQPAVDKAIEEYKAALARDPKLPNAAFAIGYLYWRQQDAESAKSWLEKQVETQPCHALAVFYLGQIARAEQDKAAAEKHYRRAISCDADSVEAHIRLGMTLEDMNQNAEAIVELKRAIELAPENSTAHYRLALVYKKVGRAKDSEAEYEIVRRLKSSEKP